MTLDDLLPVLAAFEGSRDARIGLPEAAALAGRSASHFQRVFVRIAGESPKQYQRRLQLEHAAALLGASERSVLDIALASGFDSHEGFTRAFRSQFGHAPRAFRRRAQAAGLIDDPRHAALIRTIGPCLRLFRTPRASGHNNERKMDYDITRAPIAETTVLFRRVQAPHSAIAEKLGECLPAVFGYAMQSGIAMAGPPFCRYLEMSPGGVTFEAGLPVASGAEGKGDILAAVWSAGEAWVTVHTGPYDGLRAAYEAIEKHMHQMGTKPSAPPREIYLTDPGKVPDPAQWQTRIEWPIVGGD